MRLAVAGLPGAVRVGRLGGVRHPGGLLPGVPTAVVVLRLLGLLRVRILRDSVVRLLLIVLLGVRIVRLLWLLLGVRIVRLRLLGLLRVRVVRVGLLLAVLVLAVGGLLSSPSLVPVQGILGMPRFGAGAPAILSHRSPRAARRHSVSLLCGVCSTHRHIARNVTVSRSDNHFDAFAGCRA
ncbi:hypothetical protein GCM10010433_42920 [Streptomyces pulveraceus]